jgi:hypothetical protein
MPMLLMHDDRSSLSMALRCRWRCAERVLRLKLRCLDADE